jgi:tetratricopeptide (TPR) repeat protein
MKNKKEKKKNKKIIIIISIILIIILIVLGILFKTIIYPKNQYNKANKYFKENNYEKAIKNYKTLGDYKDSKDLLNQSYFEYGKQLIEEENFSKALEMLDKTDVEESVQYSIYAEAVNKIDEKKYDEAIKTLKELDGFEKSKEYIKKAYYVKAKDLFNQEKYKDAKDNFKEADNYEDAKKQINICDLMLAEKEYKKGNLAKAKKIYSKLSKDLEYNDIKVSDRLKTLEKYSKYVNLCGEYVGKNGYFEVKQVNKNDNTWESWYNSYSVPLTIKCIVNDDGSVTIKGEGGFYIFTNYNSSKSKLKTKYISITIDKKIKADKKFPDYLIKDYVAYKTSSGVKGKASLKIDGSKLKLSYSLNDKNYSKKYSNNYTSTITFKKK